MATPINFDHPGGLTVRIGSIAGSRAEVCMYKDRPGQYFTLKGHPLPVEVARAAGFDVDGELKDKARLDRRTAAMAAIDKEFAVVPEGEIVFDAGDYRIVHTGNGWHNVEDGAGETMNPSKLRREAAEEYIEVLRKGKESEDGTT